VPGDGRAREATAAAMARSETGRRERGGAVRASAAHARRSAEERRERGGGRQLCCRDARRAVPTAALSRCASATRGGHAAAPRCRAGPVRHATADKRDSLVSDFQIKIYPEGNYLKSNSWELRQILGKFMEVGN
jgi:hypothetical protein